MTVGELLKQITERFNRADIPTARLDAEVLLAEVLQKDRSWLHAHPEHCLQGESLYRLDEMVERRARHEPIAYIIGRQEFYGREFIVSPDTLTPRPETETMIELFLETVSSGSQLSSNKSKLKTQNSKLSVVDVGTGSGCIIITAALELSKISNLKSSISYLGLDISEKALKVARKNSKKLGSDVDFKIFDLLSQSFTLHPSPFILVLANLPYVPNNFKINLAASHEPAFAIYGGKDGLDYYRALFLKLSTENSKLKTQNCNVFTESLPFQHKKLADIAKNAGFKQLKTQDFIQVFEKVRSTE